MLCGSRNWKSVQPVRQEWTNSVTNFKILVWHMLVDTGKICKICLGNVK